MEHTDASLALASIERLHGNELARISHALKTPLTSIIGFTSAILDEPEMDRETCSEFVRIIKSEGERLSRFVEELMYISFLNPSDMPIHRQITQPAAVAQTAVRLTATSLNQSVTRFGIDVEGLETPLELDREFAVRMLVNVISNAARFSSPAGRISVSGSVHEGFLRYHVLSRRRGHNLDLRSTPGAIRFQDTEALGLARTRHMLALRGGELSVSTGSNGETTITVDLPFREVPQQEPVS